ncbi:hypothetical protein TeGR_g6677 [Tetraparma gracilis]|uniref:Uncharacterized protein n=1 Tax=Tetraparma gracilis TaxID=2962635 RepID=A0ABQ6N2T9_9STRA|nr:hypothetical protein TeGR_g6677 [Tetraparma gracilis]
MLFRALPPRRLSSFSKMLDLGGSKASGNPNSRTANVLADSISKNNRVAGVIFDLPTVAAVGIAPPGPKKGPGPPAPPGPKKPPAYEPPAFVSDMAAALGVDISGGTVKKSKKSGGEAEDDLSSLLGGGPPEPPAARPPAPPPSPPSPALASSVISSASQRSSNPALSAALADGEAAARMSLSSPADSGRADPRLKYMSRLSERGVGLASLETRRSIEEETPGASTDASLLLNVRDSIKSSERSRVAGSSAWLVSAGSGAVLSYAATRSLKMALVSSEPGDVGNVGVFTGQLANVRFHHAQGERGDGGGAGPGEYLGEAGEGMGLEAGKIMVVSSHEPTLTEARDRGMYTARLVIPNARTGVTTNYEIDKIEDVVDSLNDANGLSFTTVRGLAAANYDRK